MLTDKNIPDTSFYVKAVKKPKKGTLAKQSVVMYVPDGVKFPAEGGGGGTSDFNELEHRPKYNGSPMTGSTNIPEVKPVMKTLTEADFNWNSQTHSSSGELDGIAAWLLPDGFYTVGDSTPELAQKIWLRDSGGIEAVLAAGIFYYVKHTGDACVITYVTRQTEGGGVSSIYTGIPRIGRVIVPDISNPSDNTKKFTCSGVEDIVDNLTDDASYKTLSANQGKVLKDLIDSLIISGSSAPTTATVGSVGCLYEDTTNGKLYICTAVSGNTYTWAEVGSSGGGADLRVFEYTDYNPTGQAPTKTVLTFLTEQGVDDGEWFVIKGAQTGQHIGSNYAFKITDTSDSQRYDWGECFNIDDNLGGPLYASSNNNLVGCFKYEWADGSSSQTWSLNVIGSGGVSCNATISKTVRNGQFFVYEAWYPLTVDTITYSSSFDPMGIGSDRVMDAPSIAKIKEMFQTIYSSAFPTKCIVPKTVPDFSSVGAQIDYVDFWYFGDYSFHSTSTPFDNNLIDNPDSTPYIQDYSALQNGEQVLVWIDDAYGLPYIVGAQSFEGEMLTLKDATGSLININLPEDKHQVTEFQVGRWYMLGKNDDKYQWGSLWEEDGQILTKNVNKFW